MALHGEVLTAPKLRHSPMMRKDQKGERAFEVYWTCGNCDHQLRGGMRDSAKEWRYCPYCGVLFDE